MSEPRRVAIVGGGLAGLAAAVALARDAPSIAVELFESRRQLGGRAGSFVDKQTGEEIDQCQHVAMGCCTKFLDYCRTTETDSMWERHTALHFMGPDGTQYNLRATPLLPPPLHLAGSLLRLGYLTWRDKLDISRALLQLAATRPGERLDSQSIADWLRAHGQSERALARFWSVVLVALAIVLLGCLALYTRTIPAALTAVTEPVLKLGLVKSITKTVLQGVGYPVAFLWTGIVGWKHARAA